MRFLFASVVFVSIATLPHLVRPAPAMAQSGEGFLFGSPDVVVSARAGFARPEAGSDLFAYVTEWLTLSQNAFESVTVEGSLGIPLSPRYEVGLTAIYTGRSRNSEFRDLVEEVDGVDVPIRQSTRFERVPILATGKLYLLPNGRSIGTLAWLPSRVAPYVGAGAGAVWYRFSQQGDFVDDQDLSIFTAQLDSDGWGPALQGLAGVEVTLTPRFGFTSQVNYLWSRAGLSRDFEGFDPIDLSGFSASAGVLVRL